MASNRAPGVRVKEIDLSEVTVPAGTNVGAVVGRSPYGPSNRRVLAISDKDFAGKFGNPTVGSESYEWPMYSALEYLKASDYLWFTRPATHDDKVGALQFGLEAPSEQSVISTGYDAGATALAETWEFENGYAWQTQKEEAPTTGIFSEPGYEDGNKPNKYWPCENLSGMISISALGASKVSDRLGIIIVTEANTETASLDYTYGYTWAGKYPEKNSNQQPVHYYRINVYLKGEDQTASEAGWNDPDPLKTLVPVESWIVTNDPTAKDASGVSMYVKDVVNGYSNYIYVNTNNNGFNYDSEENAPKFYPSKQYFTEASEVSVASALTLSHVDGTAPAPTVSLTTIAATVSADNTEAEKVLKITANNTIGISGSGWSLDGIQDNKYIKVKKSSTTAYFNIPAGWVDGGTVTSTVILKQILAKSTKDIENVDITATIDTTGDDNLITIAAEDKFETEGSVKKVASWFNFIGKQVLGIPKGVYEVGGAPDGDGIASCLENLYASKEQVTPNILIAPYSNDALVDTVANIASSRRDCIAVVPANGSLTMTDPQTVVEALEKRSALQTSYVCKYIGADLFFDRYTNRNIYLPKVIFAARIIADTVSNSNVWDAPAGINRGAMGTLDQLRVYTEAEIGYLYNSNINASKRVRGSGDYLWGQKTGQVKASALDRINVRNLLLYIENTLEPSLQAYLFEPNTELQRSRVKSGIDQFLETIYAGGGIYTWNTVCDTTNNTPYTIDNNELNIDLYVQPTKTVEFINLNIIVTRTGVSFTEA